MNFISHDLAEQMVWERKRADTTDPQKFVIWRDWYFDELSRREEYRKLQQRSWIKKLFSPTPKVNFCECTSTFEKDLGDIVFYVCDLHSKEFGIHLGAYYEQEALLLCIRASKHSL